MHFPHRNLKTLRRLAVPNHEILPSSPFAHIHFPSAFVHTYPTCWMVQILFMRQKSLWCDAKQSLITRSLGGCTTVLQCKKSASGTSAAASYFEAAPSNCLQSMVRLELQHFLGNPIFTSMHCSTRSLRFNPLDPWSWRKNPKSVPRNFLQKMDLSGETGGTWFTPPSSPGWMWLAPKMRFSLIALLFHCETWTIDVTYICILHTYTCLEYLMMNKGSRISKLDSQLNPGS